jgi:hypothetical protein
MMDGTGRLVYLIITDPATGESEHFHWRAQNTVLMVELTEKPAVKLGCTEVTEFLMGEDAQNA